MGDTDRVARFVGRTREVAALTDLLDRASHGRTGFALVSGEPGIGKTRLLTEFGHTAGSRGWTVRRGRASNADGAPGFWLWRQVLPSGYVDTARPVRAEDRFVLFDRICRDLATPERPTVVILDDLHWADTGSLSLLEHLVDGDYDGTLLVLGALRPAEFTARTHGTRLRTLVGRRETGTELRLDALSTAEVADLLGDTHTAAAIHARTHGNPLFVLEVSRLADGDPLPHVIRDAIQQHLAVLKPACLGTLRVAALLGSASDVDVLAAVTDQDVRTVMAHRDQAFEAGVLTATGEFQHDLFHETLRLAMSTSDRSAEHLRIAEHLPADRVTETARHRLAALPLGDPALAAASAREAGRAALAALAFESAAELFDRAAVITPGRAEPLVEASRAYFLSGDTALAKQRSRAAAEVAGRTGNAEILAEVVVALPEMSEPDWLPLIEAWSEQALAGLPPGDSSLRAQVMAQRVLTLVYAYEDHELVAMSDEAHAMAVRVGDPTAIRIALRARQIAHATPDGNATRLTIAADMLALGNRTADLDAVFWGNLWQLDALVQAGRMRAATLAVFRLHPVVQQLGGPTPRWHFLRAQIAIATAEGRFADARAMLDEIKPVTVGLWGLLLWAGQHTVLSSLTGAEFDPDAYDWNPSGADNPVWQAGHFVHLAQFHRAFGHRDELAELYLRFAANGQVPAPLTLLVAATRGAAAVELGDEEGAERDHQTLRRYPHLNVTSCAGMQLSLGSTHHYLGLTATENPVARFRDAVAANDAAGLVPYAALSRYELAKALLAKGEHAEARRVARAATVAAAKLGMPLLSARLSTLDTTMNPLTPRQREVAKLVAQGHTNRQLATALAISERTAESHVQNIMTALGFQSRSQIAVWSSQHQD
jgi:DNA-binding CsgD family transcriptional regulator